MIFLILLLTAIMAICLCTISYHLGKIMGIRSTNALWKDYADAQYSFIKQFIKETDASVDAIIKENDERYTEIAKKAKIEKGRN